MSRDSSYAVVKFMTEVSSFLRYGLIAFLNILPRNLNDVYALLVDTAWCILVWIIAELILLSLIGSREENYCGVSIFLFLKMIALLLGYVSYS